MSRISSFTSSSEGVTKDIKSGDRGGHFTKRKAKANIDTLIETELLNYKRLTLCDPVKLFTHLVVSNLKGSYNALIPIFLTIFLPVRFGDRKIVSAVDIDLPIQVEVVFFEEQYVA